MTSAATQHDAPMGLDVFSAVEAFVPGTPRLQADLGLQWDLLVQENAVFDVWSASRIEKRRDLQQARFYLERYDTSTNTTKAGKRLLEKEVATAENALADHEARKPPRTSTFNQLSEMIADLGGRRVRDVIVTDVADNGLGPAEMLLKRKVETAKIALRERATHAARTPRDQAEAAVAKAIKSLARTTNVAAVTRMGINSFDRATTGTIQFPKTAGGDVDPLAVLFDLFGEEIVDKLNARIAALYQDGEVLGNADRRDRLRALASERLAVERLVIFWTEQCRAAGIPTPNSGVSNPLAIMKVEYV